jgi:tetratricopeptide (TPR) repeat protein
MADEGETEVELPLYNRLGDLCVRLGRPQEAVRHYEQAADRYAEAGLYNNAIALCNKALRYSPDRLELIRKLGQFSASQGFITDARRYFLDYAERQFNAGKVTEALSALEDFANVSDDADVREMLGRQLHAHGRINDAVDELRRAHALRLRDGQTQQAEALRGEILAIDPNATLDAAAAAPAGGARPQESTELPGLVDIEPDRPETVPPASGTTGMEGPEGGAPTAGDGGDIDSVQLAGFESTGQPDLADIDLGGVGGIEGLETTSLDFGSVEPGSPALEDLGFAREETSFDGPAGPGDADVFDLPTLDEPSGDFDLPALDEPAGAFDLPTLEEPEGAADLPLLDDTTFEVPDTDDDVAFDLPLLGDDEPAGTADEATPMTPPQFDDAPSLDLPAPTGSQDFDLGGDLPLDLSSLGGIGSFDLPTADEDAVDVPDWKTDETAFDIPDLDGDTLDLPTWEPEPAFDLPSFEDAEEVAPKEEVPPAVEKPLKKAEAPPLPPEELPEPEVIEAATPEVVDVPAIELPTWDTDASADRAGDTGPVVDEVDAAEPVWVDSIAEEEEAATDLPTFTYEDEPAVSSVDEEIRTAGAVGTDETYAEELEADEDPLGLAAHLAGRRPAGAAQDVPARTEPLDADWLDEIAGDEAGAVDETASLLEPGIDDEPALDVSTDDAETTTEEGSVAAASVEDAAAGTARAQAAAQEMAAAPRPEPVAPSPGRAPPGRPKPPPKARTPPGEAQPKVEPPAPQVEPEPPAADREERYIDLGAFIAGDGEEEETTRFRVEETAPTGDEDRDFAELLSQFKSKVQEHLPAEDAAAHYDLGLAFKEMGLIDEAIGEFQVALRAGHMRLKVYEELGDCFLQKEQFNIAEKVLTRALTLKFDDELELLGVYYHLGRTYEALGRRDQARDAYERVLGMDINFGDVTDRLARL